MTPPIGPVYAQPCSPINLSFVHLIVRLEASNLRELRSTGFLPDKMPAFGLRDPGSLPGFLSLSTLTSGTGLFLLGRAALWIT